VALKGVKIGISERESAAAAARGVLSIPFLEAGFASSQKAAPRWNVARDPQKA